MLRYLRSRRRRPSAAYLVPLISSIFLLLLLSVSFLYSRLSLTLPRPHLLLHPTPFHSDDLRIVDDNNNNIHQLQHQESHIEGSDHFFDHVTGSTRRAFNRRSIQKWEDDQDRAEFLLEEKEDRSSKTAFASDDTPLDHEIRTKATQLAGIEDLLLIKIKGRDSPLRKGWGDWFDKKGEFLRNNKMFKSNWAVLDPMNNMILQDPDAVGLTKLTEGDLDVRKLLIKEFNRTPFQENDGEVGAVNYNATSCKCKSVIKNLDGETDNNVDAFNSDGGLRTDFRVAEHHRTSNENVGTLMTKLSDDLDENVDHGRDMKSAERNSGNRVDHAGQRKPEFLNHIYADGKTWGYYPGLPPHLAFTEFMDAFFRMGKCDLRVFMVWNLPPWMYGVRHQRGLESVLYHHRDACVVVFSETIELDFFKDNFVKDGYKVAVAMPNLDELLKDTPTHVFASVWFQWRKTKFYSTHYSELIRLAALYKYGGIYLDSDVIVLKSISSLDNSVGMENYVAGSGLNGAVMAFRKNSPFIKECLEEFYSTYDDTSLRYNGADLLTRVARNFLQGRSKIAKQLELNVEPAHTFFPISSQNITRYFMEPATKIEKAQQDVLFEKILRESLTFHFWNSLTFSLAPEPGSLVTQLIDYSCIRCLELL